MKTQRAVSFDETAMDSCSTLLQQPEDQHHRVTSDCCESYESREANAAREPRVTNPAAGLGAHAQEVTSLEEAKSVIAALRSRQRAQAHQMLAWRRTLKLQEDLVARLTREKAEQLRSLSSQLLLFESRLCRKQKEIENILAQREAIILRQQRVIRQLQNKLRLVNEHWSKDGALQGATNIRDSPPCCDALDRLDSLGDSDCRDDGDSAVVLEEAFLDDPAPPRFRSNITDVTVIRSVSDAFEPSSKYCSSARRGCNGFLRRPEVLETVYSVEEDADADGTSPGANGNSRPDAAEADEEDNNVDDSDTGALLLQESGKPRLLRDLYGSFERLAQPGCDSSDSEQSLYTPAKTTTPNQRTRDDSQQAQVTYNRVMSNHRSVTKPKDVKYKRINKAKSKSLEELRGRLRNWVEKGNKIAISLDQSYA